MVVPTIRSGLPLLVPLGHAPEIQHPAPAAVAQAPPSLDPIGVGLAPDHSFDRDPDAFLIVGMVGLASTLHVEIVGARRQAQQLFQSTVDLDLPRLEVEFPDALAAGLQRQLEPTLAFGEPPFRKLPSGDVAADRQVADHPATLVEYRSVDPFLPALAAAR